MNTFDPCASDCAPSMSQLLRSALMSIALVAAAAGVVFLPEAVAQEKTPGMLAYEAANPLGAAQVDATDVGPDESRVARYSTVTIAPTPSARAPLAIIATVNFPRGHVQTVGDAMQHLLLRTGYQLDHERLTRRAAAVLTMPLPDSHRRLGPYRVDQMLSVLLGEPWVLTVDAASRAVSYAAPGDSSPLANPPAHASPASPSGTAAAASASAPT